MVEGTSVYTYKTAGRLSLAIDVSVPPGFDKEKGTVLIHYHGGFLVLNSIIALSPIVLLINI